LQSRYEGLQILLKGLGDIESVIRDNQCYRQMMINASVMLRNKSLVPAILCQGTSECDDLCRMLYKDIVDFRDKNNADKLQKQVENLKFQLDAKNFEIDRLNNLGFWKRVFFKKVCDNG
jgi:hypothetical protein